MSQFLKVIKSWLSSALTRKKTSKDAIAILKADHAKVKKLFKEFGRKHKENSFDEARQIAENSPLTSKWKKKFSILRFAQ